MDYAFIWKRVCIAHCEEDVVQVDVIVSAAAARTDDDKMTLTAGSNGDVTSLSSSLKSGDV